MTNRRLKKRVTWFTWAELKAAEHGDVVALVLRPRKAGAEPWKPRGRPSLTEYSDGSAAWAFPVIGGTIHLPIPKEQL